MAMEPVTFKQFRKAAVSKGWTVELLAKEFRGSLDDPLAFFTRVMEKPVLDNIVIPYKSVLSLFKKMSQTTQKRTKRAV